MLKKSLLTLIYILAAHIYCSASSFIEYLDRSDQIEKTNKIELLSSTPTYAGGSGSESDPFLISTYEDLINLSTHSSHWTSSFKQINNIDFPSDYSNVDWNNDGVVNTSDNSGFTPLGSSTTNFSGTYLGQGYYIRDLHIKSSSSNVGMFGIASGATLSGILLSQVYIDCTSSMNVGGLIGYSMSSNITQCFVGGDIIGDSKVGGLIGYTEGTDYIAYNGVDCNVSGKLYLGGLIGKVKGTAIISNCSITGDISATTSVAGGCIGATYGVTVENICSSAKVTSGASYGGLFGQFISSTSSNSYWSIDDSGQSTSAGGSGVKGLTSTEMQNESNFSNWNFTDIWKMESSTNSGFPFLRSFGDLLETKEFIGNGLWTDESQWTGAVPFGGEAVIISGSCQLQGSKVSTNNLIITSEGELIVESDSEVEIENKLQIRSDASGCGEFISNNLDLSYTIEHEKYFEASEWNFASTPIDITAEDILPDLNMCTSESDESAEFWVLGYSEDQRATTQSGMEMIYDKSHVLKAGTGYMVWVDDACVATYTYTSPTSADVQDVDASYTTSSYSDDHSGWNLLGNPFPYHVEYDMLFSCSSNSQQFEAAIYFWDQGAYRVWIDGTGDVEAKTIYPLDAFFIKRKTTTDGNFYISYNGSCVGTKNINESSKVEVLSQLEIKAECEEKYDRTYIRTGEGFSVDFNTDYDARKFSTSPENTPIIYSLDDEKKTYSVNSVPSHGTSTIPLKLAMQESNKLVDISFAIEGESVYTLLDTQDNTMTPIYDGMVMTFNTEDISLSNRFKIIVANNEVVTEVNNEMKDEEKLIAFTKDQEVTLQSSFLTSQIFEVFDISGHCIYNGEIGANSTHKFQLAGGIYIVTTVGNNASSNIKLVVQ